MYHQARCPRPYFHRPKSNLPEPHNGDDPKLIPLYNKLVDMNIWQQKLCTFVHDQENYEEVPRPQRVVGRKAKDITASGFTKVWPPFSSPFYCPHLKRSGLSYDPLVLRLNGVHQGGLVDFYCATDHRCEFKGGSFPVSQEKTVFKVSFSVVALPVNETRRLVTWEDWEKFENAELLAYLTDIGQSSLLHTDPTVHPAWDVFLAHFVDIVKPVEPFNAPIRFRSFWDDKRPEWVGDAFHSPIGAAFQEWNSRLGIPGDVWSLITSASILSSPGCIGHMHGSRSIHWGSL
ncbi:hypothetical protein C8R45DRAFT_943853 [Mycena sanguinolenta]|nr:hypothetical protein C8R45DRAFT_943853 [Mycena sanguinolenta]